MPPKPSFFRLFGGKDKEIDRKTFASLEDDQKEMIQGIVELSDTTVKEVMVPRIDTVFIPVGAARAELLARVVESGHSRFPVYEDTIDNVVGVLYVKDILRAIVKDDTLDLKAIIHKPFFVPEAKRIDDLLAELRRRRVHIAIVVDEYGGVSGIVCMENILEEIIGDIQDEFDNEKEDIQDLGGGAWLCDGRADLEDIADRLAIALPTADFDTLGGFVFDLFGKIPLKHEKQTWDGHDFIIQDMDGHKINSVKIVVGKGMGNGE